ncbi:hypothetical protein NC653_003161 [Populus alba x Populus x berolinensis]|uniref:Uncharacterized protein n=1 Tax=Populus alba x Populus x berolinensis TaxID=444605 RepID=A0AAD6RRJ0_9ROSI|nr:hypothetical protein NC653_003161 [Populus alba x Populus x berolinensis]
MIVELWTWGADSQWKMKAYETVQTMETTLVISVYSLENTNEIAWRTTETRLSARSEPTFTRLESGHAMHEKSGHELMQSICTFSI